MPTVHPAHWIRMDGKRDVLMHPSVAPPHAFCVWIFCRVPRDSLDLPHLPLPFSHFLQINPGARHPLHLIFLVNAPAAEMMRARHNAGSESFRDPGMQHEVTDF